MAQGDAVNYRDYRNVSGNSTVKFRPAAGTSIKIDFLHNHVDHNDADAMWHWYDFENDQRYDTGYGSGNLSGSNGNNRRETKLHLDNEMGLAIRYRHFDGTVKSFAVASGIQVK